MPDHELVLLAALIADGNLTDRDAALLLRGRTRRCCDEVHGGGRRLSAHESMSRVRAGERATSRPATARGPTRCGSSASATALWGKRSRGQVRSGDRSSASPITRSRASSPSSTRCDGHVYASGTLSPDRLHDDQRAPRTATCSTCCCGSGSSSKIRTLKRSGLRRHGQGRARGADHRAGRTCRRSSTRSACCGKDDEDRCRSLDGLRAVRAKTNVDTVPPEAWDLVTSPPRATGSWAEVSDGRRPSAQPQLARRLARPVARRSSRCSPRRSTSEELRAARRRRTSGGTRSSRIESDRRARDVRHRRSRATTTSSRTTSSSTTPRWPPTSSRTRPSATTKPAVMFSLEMGGVRAGAAVHRQPGVDQGQRPAARQGVVAEGQRRRSRRSTRRRCGWTTPAT